jgi:hypothetical protein
MTSKDTRPDAANMLTLIQLANANRSIIVATNE